MAADCNPWTDRFRPLLNRRTIRKRVELRPEPIIVTGDMSPLEASERVNGALSKLFYPNSQCIDFLLEWLTIAWLHSCEVYGSHRAFMEGVYKSPRESPLPQFRTPLCLTGLAGMGKSALVNALERLMPVPSTVAALDGTEFPLESYRAITVRSCSTPREILMQFVQSDGTLSVLSNRFRGLAFRNGLAILLQDEFQFATQSREASTRVTQMILAMCYMGVPPVYAANYSLLHKLKNRNQEETDRLLANPRILVPDAYDSDDWRTLLRWSRDVAPNMFTFDPEGDAEAIHNLTAGIKRHVAALLGIASKDAVLKRRAVDYAGLEKAYKGLEYATFRDTVEALPKLFGALRKKRTDLWCPLAPVDSLSGELPLKRSRQKLADEEALKDSLNLDERKALARQLKKPVVLETKAGGQKVTSIRTKRADAKGLQENIAWFKDNQ